MEGICIENFVNSGETPNLNSLPDDVRQQLNLLDSAEQNLAFILASLLIRIKVIDVQRDMLLTSALCPEEFAQANYPDVLDLQVAASILVLYALLEFHKIAEQTAKEAKNAGSEAGPEEKEVFLSLLIITVNLIRFGFLLATAPEEKQSQITPEQIDNDIEAI